MGCMNMSETNHYATKHYAKECLIAMELGIDFKRYEMNELHDIIINKIKFITNKLKNLEE